MATKYKSNQQAYEKAEELLNDIRPDKPEYVRKEAASELQDIMKSDSEDLLQEKVFKDFRPELTPYIEQTASMAPSPAPRPEPVPSSRLDDLSPEEVHELRHQIQHTPNQQLNPKVDQILNEEYNPTVQDNLEKDYQTMMDNKPNDEAYINAQQNFNDTAMKNQSNAISFMREKYQEIQSSKDAAMGTGTAAQKGAPIFGSTGDMIYAKLGDTGRTVGGNRLEAQEQITDTKEDNLERREELEVKDTSDYEADQSVIKQNEIVNDAIDEAIGAVKYQQSQDPGATPEAKAS